MNVGSQRRLRGRAFSNRFELIEGCEVPIEMQWLIRTVRSQVETENRREADKTDSGLKNQPTRSIDRRSIHDRCLNDKNARYSIPE